MLKIKQLAWMLLGISGFLGSSAHCWAQCSDGSTVIYWIDSLYRTGGNNVEAVIGTQVVGDYSDYWGTYVSGSEYVGGSTLINSGSDNQLQGGNDVPGSVGSAAGWRWNNSPANSGAGTYNSYSYHQASSACGETQSQNLTAGLTVNKPTISGIDCEWYLGPNGQNQSGYGSAHAMTANTNCGANDTCGAPVWTWTTADDPSEITFGCNPCTNQTIYAHHRSDQFRDIQLRVSTDGFFSDPLPYTVYAPYAIHEDSYTDNPDGDGYQTIASLSLYDRFGDQISGLATNESFDETLHGDYPGFRGYSPPTPNAWPAGWPTLGDSMSLTNCAGGVPRCTNPPTPYSGTYSTTEAFHNLQNWFSGSPVVGNGLKIRTDTQQYYIDHARYTVEASPLDP